MLTAPGPEERDRDFNSLQHTEAQFWQHEDMTVAIGTLAPRATLQSHLGGERTIPDEAGTNLLVFYRGDW